MSDQTPVPYVCGSHCQYPHDGNGPSGYCPKGHGPYLYFCKVCHDEWAAANPERVAEISRSVKRIMRRA